MSWFKSSYTTFLEKEVERLREDLKQEKEERERFVESVAVERNGLLDRIMQLSKVKPLSQPIHHEDEKPPEPPPQKQRVVGPSSARITHYNLEEQTKAKQQPASSSVTINMPQVPDEARIISGAKKIIEGDK